MTRISVTVALALLALSMSARAETAADPLIGMWMYQTSFDVGSSGTLTVTRDGANWHATIADSAMNFSATGNDIRFAFVGERGRFSGTLIDGGRTIDGFWRRREMTDDPRYPEGAAQAYAMPVVLRLAGPNTWRGEVKPLEDPFTLYLKVFRDADGKLAAAFRNPEMHHHGPAMRLRVTRTHVERGGDAVRFSAQPDPAQPEVHLDATLMHGPERIRIFWEFMSRVIELTPVTPQQGVKFFPHPPGEPPYAYRRPETTDDGWETARAGELGMDEAALVRAVQRIIDIDPTAARGAWLVHSMAVAYRGKLVLDEYFYGYGRDTPHDLRSAGKTFGSVLVGAAMLHGTNISPQTKLYDLVAPMGPFANPDPRKSEITLAHVMTHSTGLACDDNDEKSPGNEDTMETQRAQPNWWKHVLDVPMVYEPGTHYAYCSGGINLTGAMLTMATKTSVPELFDRLIARPLQWRNWYWNVMPTGEGYLGGGTFVRLRDFLKIGQLFLDGGVWHGKRIVSAAWVKDSTAPHMRISPETTGRTGDAFAEVYAEGDDGYSWHLGPLTTGGRTYSSYFANGNGGQLLIVVPELELAVAFNAGNYRQGLWWQLKDSIVRDTIIPAIRALPARSQ